MRETMQQVSSEQLDAIVGRLEAKANGFGALLGTPGAARSLPADDLWAVLRCVFGARRKANVILATVGPERLGAAIDDLLHGQRELPERFEAFDAHFGGELTDAGFDLPGELLHFTWPDRYWMW